MTIVLNRWVDGDRPAPPLIVAVLALSAIAGFIAGGVFATLPTGADAAGAGASTAPTVPPATVEITDVEASCQRESGVDQASNPVEYRPEFVFDEDTQTAWRCDGDGAGETLTIDLGEPVAIGELGIIPGYAKVDPHEGTEWYPLNRRLTEVQWHFDDGEPLVQTLDPNPDLRDLQTIGLDEPRTTSTVQLEIMSSVLAPDGSRDSIAVTEVAITAG